MTHPLSALAAQRSSGGAPARCLVHHQQRCATPAACSHLHAVRGAPPIAVEVGNRLCKSTDAYLFAVSKEPLAHGGTRLMCCADWQHASATDSWARRGALADASGPAGTTAVPNISSHTQEASCPPCSNLIAGQKGRRMSSRGRTVPWAPPLPLRCQSTRWQSPSLSPAGRLLECQNPCRHVPGRCPIPWRIQVTAGSDFCSCSAYSSNCTFSKATLMQGTLLHAKQVRQCVAAVPRCALSESRSSSPA